MPEFGKDNELVADKAPQLIGLLMRTLEEFFEQPELVHHLERRGMDGVAAGRFGAGANILSSRSAARRCRVQTNMGQSSDCLSAHFSTPEEVTNPRRGFESI